MDEGPHLSQAPPSKSNEFVVEHRAVAAYRESLGPTLETCDVERAPSPVDVVPLTYFMATGWSTLVDAGSQHLESLGVAGAPLTLVRYSLEADRPVAIGDHVQTEVLISSQSRAPGGSFVTFDHDTLLDGETDALARQTSTVLVQGLSSVERDRTLLQRDTRGRTGQPLQFVLRLAQDLADAFATASGDLNPIHIDPDAARSAGFDRVVVHGMCLLALALECVPSPFPVGKFSLSCQFGPPAHPGEDLTVSVWPASTDDGPRRFAFNAATKRSVALKNGLLAVAGPRAERVV